MGIMKAWENLSQKMYDSWGSKLQGKYDKYRDLKTPDWYIKATDEIWDNLDEKVKEYLNTFVTETCAKFDEAFAFEFIKKLVGMIKKKLDI